MKAEVDCDALLRVIFLTQGSNPCLISPALAGGLFLVPPRKPVLYNVCCCSLVSCVQLFATPWTATQRPPWPSQSTGACSNSCPLSQRYHPTISSSVVPFLSCLQSFPASGSFPVSRLFTLVAKILELQHHSAFNDRQLTVVITTAINFIEHFHVPYCTHV